MPPTKVDQYNLDRIASGDITPADITSLVTAAQRTLGVRPDGFCGPVTLEALRAVTKRPVEERFSVSDGWLWGASARFPSHISWYGGPLKTPNKQPLGIVVHTSATAAGTAVSMAKRRVKPFDSDPDNRMASWHLSIETDGSVVQQISMLNCAWHAGSPSAKKLDFGWANYTTVGIELISPDDKNFPEAQVEAAKHVWRAIVRSYGIPQERAMITHASIDPQRRADPGPEWMSLHVPKVLEFAYA